MVPRGSRGLADGGFPTVNTILVALAILLAAGPAAVLRRFGRWPVRWGAVGVLVVLFVAALDLPRRVARPVDARLAVVTTAGAKGPGISELRDAARGAISLVPARGDVLGALARVALAADPDEVVRPVVLWTGRFEPTGAPEPVVSGVMAVSAVPPPPVDPAQCSVRVVTTPRARRPCEFELRVEGASLRTSGLLVVRDPRGKEVLRETVPPGAWGRHGSVAVPWEPSRPGEHAFVLEVRTGSSKVIAEGRIPVGPPPSALVVGRGAESVAAALKVQGWSARAVAHLPDPAEGDVVVILERLSPDDQARLAGVVRAGVGLLMVGGADGGALPLAGEPLAALAPVIRLPGRSGAMGEHGAPYGPPAPRSGPRPRQPAPEREVKPPAAKPSEPPHRARGDTRGAQVRSAKPSPGLRRRVALVLVVDRSESMGLPSFATGVTKMQYAKTAALRTAEALEPGDEVGVVTFGINGRVELELTPAEQHERIARRLAGLTPYPETTLIEHALRKAGEMLRRSKAAQKHVVVISDGEIYDLRESKTTRTAREIAAQGVTISLIQILGDQPVDAFHARLLARIGGGTYAWTKDPSQIPRLVTTEVDRVLVRAGRPRAAGEEKKKDAGASGAPGEKQPAPKPEPEPQVPPPPPEPGPRQPAAAERGREALAVRAVADSVLLRPIPRPDWPPVRGITPVAARKDARVLLVAGEGGVPLLAFASRGLGRIAAWTSDLAGPWAAAWREDPEFPGRLAKWAAALAPPLPPAASADRVVARRLEPPAPTARERAWLAVLGGRLRTPAEVPAPGAEIRERLVGRAQEGALYGLAALLALALLEFVVLRRWGW